MKLRKYQFCLRTFINSNECFPPPFAWLAINMINIPFILLALCFPALWWCDDLTKSSQQEMGGLVTGGELPLSIGCLLSIRTSHDTVIRLRDLSSKHLRSWKGKELISFLFYWNPSFNTISTTRTKTSTNYVFQISPELLVHRLSIKVIDHCVVYSCLSENGQLLRDKLHNLGFHIFAFVELCSFEEDTGKRRSRPLPKRGI